MGGQRHTTIIKIGRILLGLYFLLPGIMKVVAWDQHIELMQHHNIAFAPPLLLVATVANIVLGALLIFGRFVTAAAYASVAYIIVINFSLHDFWNFDGVEGAHELQNFVKNLGILSGLLVLAGYSADEH